MPWNDDPEHTTVIHWEFTIKQTFRGMVVWVRPWWKTTPGNPPRAGVWRKATMADLPELMDRLRKPVPLTPAERRQVELAKRES